ncbi:unnamed protein product [Linum trigynum]|uniref:CCHC-type domain-containing protein n=1 Tax=Linum trigynum TaxID=586398 RepID=A0AAV2FFZ2_9ROSI
MLKPLPAVEVALDDILQHEQKLQGDKGKSTRGIQSVALAAQGQGEQNKGFIPNKDNKYEPAKEGKFCRYCKMGGHLKEECYRLKNKKARMLKGALLLVQYLNQTHNMVISLLQGRVLAMRANLLQLALSTLPLKN